MNTLRKSILFLSTIFSICWSTLIEAQSVKIQNVGESITISNDFASLDFNLKTGRYSGKDIKGDKTVFTDASFVLDGSRSEWKQPKYEYTWSEGTISDIFGKGKKLMIKHTPLEGYQLVHTLEITLYEGFPSAVLGFSVTNQFDYPARIRKVAVLHEAKLFEGAEIENPKVLKGGAGAEAQFVENELDIDAFNSVMVTGKVNGTRSTIVVGGLKYKEFFRRILLSSKEQLVSLICEDPQGKYIAPKQTYNADDTVIMDFATVDPFMSLESYGLAMRKANNAKPNMYDFPTLCGWLVSSEYYGEGKPINNSVGLVAQTKLAKEAGLMKYTPIAVRLEPDYYCYDDFGDTPQGWWDNEHWSDFPSAEWPNYPSLMSPYNTFGTFSKAVNNLGGLVFTYFQLSLPSNDFAVAHPDWMLNNDISMLHAEHPHHMPFVKYDYTDRGFQEYVLKMWKSLRSQGVAGIKFDYPESAWAKDGGFEDKTYTTTSTYRKAFELSREGLGQHAFLHERNLGEYQTPMLDVTAGIVDLQRVWWDSSDFKPEMASRMGLRWYKNRSVFNYYPDGKSLFYPESKEPLPSNVRRTILTQIGLLSGRLELATSFGSMTEGMKHDVTRLYPVLQGTKSFRPVDMLQGKKQPEVYVYDINAKWSQVILCNNEQEVKIISAPLSGIQYETGSLGLQPNKEYYVYDFWNQKLIGIFSGKETLKIELEAQQALVYSIHEVEDRPQFISTNRHLMQGLMELHTIHWNEKKKIYSGKADVVGGETMEIVIASNGYNSPTAKVSVGSVRVSPLEENLVLVQIDCDSNKTVNWELSF